MLTRTNAVEPASSMKSKGFYDAVGSSESPQLGVANSRTGVEVAAIQNALRDDGRCYLTCVPLGHQPGECSDESYNRCFQSCRHLLAAQDVGGQVQQ